MRPLRILLIDDDGDSYVITRSLLSRAEGVAFELEWESTYETGLMALLRGGHDACLLDYRLGAQDGLELLREALAEGCRTPIVLLTGQGDHGIDLAAMRAGAADYLVKEQLNSLVLERAMRYAIERSRASEDRLRNATHLRMLTDQLPAVLWTTDCQMHLTSLLGAGLFGLKRRPDEAIGRTLSDFLGDKDHPAIAATRRALEGESAAFEAHCQGRTFRGHVDLLRQPEGQVAGTIGVALDITDHKHMEEDFRVARKIQEGLLPIRPPVVAGLDIAGVCHPAAATGGDYFDYLFMPDGSLGIVIADVSNHGFAPALIMAGTRRLLRTLAERSNDIGEILTAANRAIVEDTRAEHFVTLFFAQLHPRTRSLAYAGAGHEGYVIDSGGAVKKLESTCLPLGIDPELIVSRGKPSILEPGQLLALFTDGFCEALAADGSLFGYRRALEIVHSHRHQTAGEILDVLYRAVRDFCRPEVHHDDVSAVIVRVETKYNP